MTDHGDPLDETDEVRDPALKDAIGRVVGEMVRVAGSNRQLEEQSGVSEGTIRNLRSGRLPTGSTAKAAELDAWAAARLPDHPPAGSPDSLAGLLARWQGRPVDAAAAEPPAPTPRRRSLPLLVAAAVVLALVAVGATLAVRRVGAADVAGPPGVTVDPGLVLDEDNFCAWHLETEPIPLASLDPLVMRTDARCTFPAQPDPMKDIGAAVYDAPDNDTAQGTGVLRAGNTFVPLCFTVSDDLVVDAAEPPNESRIWLLVENPRGYLPDVNVGGGYSEVQLRSMGLRPCTAADG